MSAVASVGRDAGPAAAAHPEKVGDIENAPESGPDSPGSEADDLKLHTTASRSSQVSYEQYIGVTKIEALCELLFLTAVRCSH